MRVGRAYDHLSVSDQPRYALFPLLIAPRILMLAFARRFGT